MKVVSLEIANVKSFRSATKIDFHREFNVLIGPNGGGKSNLLDIINIVLRHFFIKTYKIVLVNYGADGDHETIQEYSAFQNIDTVLERFIGNISDSQILITIEIEKQDIENITTLKNNKNAIRESLKSYYNNNWSVVVNEVDNWDLSSLFNGQKLSYKICNNQVIPSDSVSESTYLRFLNLFHLFLILYKKGDEIKLSPRYIYFSPYRADSHLNLQASLSSESYYDLLANYSSVTSRQPASLIKIASLYFADKRRKLEQSATITGYKIAWDKDEEVKLVSKYLEKLGYEWNLELKNSDKNIYQIVLVKDGRTFNLGQASSGEKEIINFLLGIFAFNIKDGLIIIDEPEVHLHPRWQNLLVELFLDLANLTGNQFILSTHSSIFINQQTLSSITRIYREKDISSVAAISQAIIPNAKDLLHIINSHNNEKIFFADKVVLVEGVTDRIFFESLIRLYQQIFAVKTEIVEVLEVHGKINLSKYRQFLENLLIQNFIIADLDYVEEIGNEEIKKLFVVDYESIDNNVIKNKKSQDGKALAKELESAIETKDLEKLTSIFEYIKSRKKKLKENRTPAEKSILDTFLEDKTSDNIFLLKLGEIEEYIPRDAKSLDVLIEAMRNFSYVDIYLSSSFLFQRKELSRIVFSILNLREPADDEVCSKLRTYQKYYMYKKLKNLIEISYPVFSKSLNFYKLFAFCLGQVLCRVSDYFGFGQDFGDGENQVS